MKNSNSITKGAAAAVALVAVVGIATVSFAFPGNGMQNDPDPSERRENRPNISAEEKAEWQESREARRAEAKEHREEARNAVESGDHEAWVEAVGEDSPMAENVNEDNFSKLMEAHELREEARNMMEEMGVERGSGGMGCHGGGGPGHKGSPGHMMR